MQQTQCSSERGYISKIKDVPEKSIFICKEQARSPAVRNSQGCHLQNVATVSLHYVSVHVRICALFWGKRGTVSQTYRSRAEAKEDILMSSILPTERSEVDKIKSNSLAIVSCYHSIDHRVSLFKQRCLRKSWGRVSLGLHSQYYSHDRTSVWCEQLTTEMQQTLAKYRLINVANGWWKRKPSGQLLLLYTHSIVSSFIVCEDWCGGLILSD